MSSLAPAVLKLIEVIEEENTVLREHRIVFHAGFTDRKNHALRELMAAQRSDGLPEAARGCRTLLERLSSALRTNTAFFQREVAQRLHLANTVLRRRERVDQADTVEL